jgi:hypothetical protein
VLTFLSRENKEKEMSQATDDFVLDIDVSNIPEMSGDGGGAPALPPGEYVFDLVHMEQSTSRTNNPTIKVTFESTEGDYAGTRLTHTYSMQQQALGRWAKLANACGAQLTKIVKSEFIGARIRASVVHNEGAPMTKPDGSLMAPRVFANVANERALEEAQPAAAAPPPPVTRKAAGNGAAAARRA